MKTKTIALLITALTINIVAYSQPSLEWGYAFGPGEINTGKAIAADPSGNVVITGTYRLGTDFDPGSGIATLPFGNQNYDIFIQKLDPNGNFLWVKGLICSDNFPLNIGTAIKCDLAGNVYVAGLYSGTVDFDPGAGTHNETCNGSNNVFLLKLDPNGNFLWVKTIDGASNSSWPINMGLEIDILGNVILVGPLEGTADFDPGTGSNMISSNGLKDFFVQKYTPAGSLSWTKVIGGIVNDLANSISSDNSGNIYLTGSFEGGVDLDPGSGVDIHSSNGNTDIFVLKLDMNGNYVWGISEGSNNEDEGNSIVVDASGNSFISGSFKDVVDFDPDTSTMNLYSTGTSFDSFIQKLDPNGNLIWAKSYGNSDDDFAKSLNYDQTNGIYISGEFYNTVDFNPGIGTNNITAGGFDSDIYFLKLDTTGNFQWARSIQTDGTSIESSCLDASGNFFYTGGLGNSVNIDPNGGTHTLNHLGGMDNHFVVKYSSTVGIDEIVNSPNFSIYPNPFKNTIMFNLNNEIVKEISILDISGKLINTHLPTSNKINTTNLKSGVYFIRITTEQGTITKQIIKQ